MLNYCVCQFFFTKSGQFSTCFVSETKSVVQSLAFLTQVTHYLPAVKTKKNCQLENLLANVLNSSKCKEWVDRDFIAVCL